MHHITRANFNSSGKDAIRVPIPLLRAILDQDQAAPARLWLLLQTAPGRGVVDLEAARALARGPDDLEAGAGLFWTINGDRLFLRSPGRVLSAIGRRARGGAGVSVPVPVAELRAGPEAAAVAMRCAVEVALSPAERAAWSRPAEVRG